MAKNANKADVNALTIDSETLPYLLLHLVFMLLLQPELIQQTNVTCVHGFTKIDFAILVNGNSLYGCPGLDG